jgi:D-glycerate 3-kinase
MPQAPHTIRIKSARESAREPARGPVGGSVANRPPGFAAAVVARALDDALAHDAKVFAIAGLQGSGKSTLAAQMAALARSRGLRVATLSIDDVYFGPRERRRLARDIHPLLATRGPPGTHDIALACDTLDALRAGASARLPRFDKRSDRRLPPSRWPGAAAVDLILLEGWCLRVPPEPAEALRAPINALERDEDPAGVWRTYCNDALGRDYPALWARIDRLLWLQPPGFAPVAGWRRQQEIRAGGPLSRAEIGRFVQHFERVSRQALRTLPGIAARTLTLDARRRVLHPPW